MARLYANENFPLPVVELLRQFGRDVLTSRDAGNSGRAVPDAEVLSFAVNDRRAVITFNRRHFIRLHADRPVHCGILVCSFDSDFPALAQRIHGSLSGAADVSGLLLRVNRDPT